MANLGYDPNNPYLMTSVYDPLAGGLSPYRTTSYPEEKPEMAKFMTAPVYGQTKSLTPPSFDTTPPPIFYTPQGSSTMQQYYSPYVPMNLQAPKASGVTIAANNINPAYNTTSTNNSYNPFGTNTTHRPTTTTPTNTTPTNTTPTTTTPTTTNPTTTTGTNPYGTTPLSAWNDPNYKPTAYMGRYDNDTYNYWKQGYDMFSNNGLENDKGIQAIKALLDAQGQNAYNDAMGQMTAYTGGSLNSAAAGAASSAKQNANLQLAAQLPAILSQQRSDYLNYLNFGGTRGDAEYERYADDRNFAASENQRKFDKNLAYGNATGYMPSGMLDTGATPTSPYGTVTQSMYQIQNELAQAQQRLNADIALANRQQNEVERSNLVNEAMQKYQNETSRLQVDYDNTYNMQKLQADIAFAERQQDEVERAALIAEAIDRYNAESSRIQANASMLSAKNSSSTSGLDNTIFNLDNTQQQDQKPAVTTARTTPYIQTQTPAETLAQYTKAADGLLSRGSAPNAQTLVTWTNDMKAKGVPAQDIDAFMKKYNVQVKKSSQTPTVSPIRSYYVMAQNQWKNGNKPTEMQIRAWVDEMYQRNLKAKENGGVIISDEEIAQFAKTYNVDLENVDLMG